MKLFVVAISLLAAVGCGKEESKAAGSYTVRGLVKSLQTAGPGEIQIHHEAIPEFVNREGEEAGMMSMSMPFGVQKGVSLEGIEPGDKVEIRFDVHWKVRPTTQISAITELPADTELNLSGM